MDFSQITNNIPNLITLARMLMTPVAVLMIVSDRYLAAFLTFLLAGVSDAVDGFIARRFHLRTELGAYLDPLADKALLISIYVALAIYGELPAWVTIAVVSRDVMILVAVIVSWLLDKPVEIRPVWVSKLNTAAQIALAGFALGARAYGVEPLPSPDHARMGGRGHDGGLGRRLCRPVARSHDAPMTRSVDAFSLLVPSYAEGLAFFRDALGFSVVEDKPLEGDKRWVVVAPAGGAGAKIVLAVPGDERQRARLGDQTGGRVGYFLQTGDFDRDYRALRARGVRFLEAPRREPYGIVAVFSDPWGGKWDLIQPIRAADPPA